MSEKQLKESQIVCVSNAYLHKYYLGSSFKKLPDAVKKELQIACVLFTEQVGGILTLSFNDDKNLYINTTYDTEEGLHDEIGTELKIKRFQMEKRELLSGIERYYNEFIKERI